MWFPLKKVLKKEVIYQNQTTGKAEVEAAIKAVTRLKKVLIAGEPRVAGYAGLFAKTCRQKNLPTIGKCIRSEVTANNKTEQEE